MTACANCGFELAPEMRFCPRCGTPAANGTGMPRRRRTGIALVPDGSSEDLCEIEYWHGYLKADFGARLVANGVEIARSRLFWWRYRRQPDAEGDALAAHQELVERLRELGWEPIGRPRPWYAQRFRRASDPATEPPAEESESPAEIGGGRAPAGETAEQSSAEDVVRVSA
jgi:hypothetical protein